MLFWYKNFLVDPCTRENCQSNPPGHNINHKISTELQGHIKHFWVLLSEKRSEGMANYHEHM